MKTEQQRKEHQWLQRLIGEWTYEFEASPGPDQPAEKSRGTESVRPLGNLWVLIEARGETSSSPDSQITLGFDAQRGQFVGSFISIWMSRLWTYDGGTLEGDKKLVLTSVGPDMADESKTTSYEDTFEIVSDTERSFTSRAKQPDGSWLTFMRGRYRRVGKPERRGAVEQQEQRH